MLKRQQTPPRKSDEEHEVHAVPGLPASPPRDDGPSLRRQALGLLAGVVALGLALGAARALTTANTGDRFFVLFVLPALLAAWLGGTRIGLLVTLLAGLLHETFLRPPGGYLHENVWELLPLTAFLLTAAISATLAGRMAELARRARREAAEGRGLLSNVLEQMRDGVIACDRSGRVTMMNPAARRHYGGELADVAEAVGEGAALRVAAQGEPTADQEVQTRDANGRTVLLDVHASPLRGEKGDLLGGVATFRDVTRQRAEHQRQIEQSLFLTTVLETMTDAVIVGEPGGKLALFNRAAREVCGQGATDLPPEQWPEHYQAFEADGRTLMPTHRLPVVRALAGETVLRLPMVLKPKGLPPRRVDWVATPLCDAGGDVTAGLIVGRDVTAEYKSEQERRRLWTISEDIFAESDREGRWTALNPAWGRILGRDPAACLGESLFDLVHPDDLPSGRERFAQVVAGDPMSHYQVRWRHADGSYRWLSWNVQVDPDADANRVHGVARDVTEQQADRARLDALVEELHRSNGELQDFASVASHDLQEPLRKITAFGDRLAGTAGGLDEKSADYLARMLKAARRMQTLINDLLDFSRVTTRAQPPEVVDLNDVAAAAVADLELAAEEAGAAVEVGELPEVEADPTQMRQVLQNLLANALKFRKTGPDAGRPMVRVTGRVLAAGEGAEPAAGSLPEGLPAATEPTVEVRVADNGIGFEPHYVNKVFQIFQRLHGREAYEGTGIGLAVCRKIAERHGGLLTVDTEPGRGATFVLRLPARAAEQADPPGPSHPPAAAAILGGA